MSKKNRSITLVFVVLLVSAAILLLSAAAAKVPADTSARIEQAKLNIISSIKDGNYIEAQTQTQKLLADFPANSALPETLYDIAENFRWFGSSDRDKDKYERAGKVYRQIIASFPDSPFASKAQLGIAKTKALSLVIAQDFNSADLALNEMVAAFQNHPNLADELYWVGRAFGYWERHEEEKDAYQLIIQNYPDNQYADRARLGFAKASVQSLIMSKDYNGAEEALDKMVTDFPEHPDLPESLYWIAERYEWSGRYEDAKRVHQQIIQNFPDSPFVSKAKFGYSKANVRSFIMSQDYDGAKQALDKLIVDFNDNPDLPRTVLEMVEQCYKHADFRRQNTGLDKQAVDDFQKTKDVAKEIAESFHQYDWIVPEARLYMAYCDYQLGQYKEAAQNSQEIAANWPGYEYIHYAQLLIAGSYEKLAETGVISMSEADYQIEQALAAVIEKETKIDKESIARALLELGRWYVKIGEKDLAVNVYEDLIMRMDDPNNPDALAAKAELEKLR